MTRMKLHIANGDAITPDMESRGLDGTILPWREALVDGPVAGPLATEQFWNVRKAFVEGAYGASPASYETDIIEVFMKIVQVGSWSDIVLWFDRDLFCVVNATFLLYHLRPSHAMGARITWMLAGSALGSNAPEGSAIELTRYDLAYASQMWRAYAGPEPRDLERLILEEDAGSLSFVRDAYELHLQRFPSVDTGRSPLEETLLATDDPEPLTRFLREGNEGFGFGDVQIERVLNRLKLDPLPPPQLGGYTPGVQGAELRWDNTKGQLVEV